MSCGVRDRRALVVLGVVVLLGLAIVVAGVVRAPREGVVLTDRVGPEQGEQVSDYLDRARATLDGAAEPRYALVSFTAEIAPWQVATVAAGVRVSQVLYRVPIPRVQTTLVPVSVPDDPWALLQSAGLAARALDNPTTVYTADERRQRIDVVSAARLEDGCACIVGLVVRGTSAQLGEIATRSGVRAIEALPVDAVFGRFAVAPLLPQQTDVVAPGPDDGEVPTN